MPILALIAVLSSDSGFLLAAEQASADKSLFYLFNPTPRSLLREMSTDRPDRTEAPFTVDAGHFQVEMDVLNYSYDRYNPERVDTRAESVAIAPMNLKLGLLNQVDFQVILESYTSTRIHGRTTGTVEEHRGFGDVLTRLKINLWGNDGGSTALGVMPFLKLPTNQDRLGNDSVEGGLIFPFAAELPFGWGVGTMFEVDFNRDERGGGYHAEYINTITVGHGIVGRLAGYIEFFSAISAESGADWIGTFNVGFTYGRTEDIQLDAGVNLGVTRAGEDINPFIGISFRF